VGNKTGRVAGKVALITGGARGQGRAHAIRLAEEGADVIITDICEPIEGVHYALATEEDLAETARLVEKLGQRCLAFKADARDVSRMTEIVGDAVAELGHLDSVIINHGVGLPHSIDLESLAAWDTVIENNLTAVYRTVVVAVPHLRAAGGGTITVTGSGGSLVPLFGNEAYTVSKHGVISLVKCLAADLAQDWIRVNAVCPTNVNTELLVNDYNIGRFNPGNPDATVEDLRSVAETLNLLPVPWIEPEDVSHAVLFLASDEAKFITGIALPVDAGMTSQPPGMTPLLGRRMWEARNGM
jgi:(+)-trans-carveol dehydrogenase